MPKNRVSDISSQDKIPYQICRGKTKALPPWKSPSPLENSTCHWFWQETSISLPDISPYQICRGTTKATPWKIACPGGLCPFSAKTRDMCGGTQGGVRRTGPPYVFNRQGRIPSIFAKSLRKTAHRFSFLFTET